MPRIPLFGWNHGLSEVCGFWSDAPRQALPNLAPEAAKKVLVVQGAFDPQTGYEQAKALPGLRAYPWCPWRTLRSTASPCVDLGW
ncbi:alpha/beta hydrolase [Amycolatopsis sp. lyj-109]|uniref:alpha/beta hydrolase n=1 Tax=Amycolatopsis sp. lyj-109 TaxID=2789287 RepID=UPI00397C41FF